MFDIEQSIAQWRRQMPAIACAAQIIVLRLSAGWRWWCGTVAIFSIVTVWLLHGREEKTAGCRL